MTKTKKEFWDEFERYGETGVRAGVNTGSFSGKRRVMASAWLDEKDQEKLERKEASLAKGRKTTESSKDAAWVAAKAAKEANQLAKKANKIATKANKTSETANQVAWAALGVSIIAGIVAIIALLFKN